MKAVKRLVFLVGALAVLVVLLHSPANPPTPAGSESSTALLGSFHPPTIQPSEEAKTSRSALTGDAAEAALRESGHYASLGEALSAARHAVEKIDPAGPHSRGAEYFAANPGQQLRAWFANDGIELASGIPTPEGEEPWNVKLRLQGIGRGNEFKEVSPGIANGKGSRIEIEHPGSAVTQWFENSKEGLEQGFTLEEPPTGGPGEVTLLMKIAGTLMGETSDEPDAVRFVDEAGTEVLHYTGLKAWDAKGRDLLARMEVRTRDKLALVVADADALYPVTIDPMFANVEARLVEESGAGDLFGSSVAISGDTALIGAPGDDRAVGSDVGSAYVFGRSGSQWSLQARLKADDADTYDQFGNSVALESDTALVGAYSASLGPGLSLAGSAYVFVRTGVTWSQQAKLTADDGSQHDYFGNSVALSGETALVGAWQDDFYQIADTGSAYVFVRNGTLWSQQAKLISSSSLGDRFGSSVAIRGDRALIGAFFDDTIAGSDAGSAHVFTRVGSVWSREATLTAEDAATGDWFGRSVALTDDHAVVGASYSARSPKAPGGSAYVFTRTGTVWSQENQIHPDSAVVSPLFGLSVAISGHTVLIGTASERADVFTRSGTSWSEQARLTTDDGLDGDNFGCSVAIDGDTLLVGSSGCDTNAGYDAGKTHVFTRSGTSWNIQQSLLLDHAPSDDEFGTSVALSGDTVLIGAPRHINMVGDLVGSAYVFARTGSGWNLQAQLNASDAEHGDAFGYSVTLDGDTGLVGAPERSGEPGSAYVFVRSGELWSQQAKLIADGGTGTDNLGRVVALDANTALIGAWSNSAPPQDIVGSAYVFRRSGTEWSQQARLVADGAPTGNYFGWSSVAVAGDTALIGAHRDNTAAGSNAGRVYLFTFNGESWSQQSPLTASDSTPYAYFGRSVALDGDTALIGASGDACAYVFSRSGSSWSEQAKLTAVDTGDSYSFGSSVALSRGIALIGAPYADNLSGENAGNAYVFARTGMVWSQQIKLTAGVDASGDDKFGHSVALGSETALIGALEDDTAAPDSGSAYVFLLGDLPEITQQPQSRTVVPGQAATFSVTATGYEPLSYQWRKDGYLIDGASGEIDSEEIEATYTIPSAQLSDQGAYDCVVSNIGGVATSAPATLSVNDLCDFTWSAPALPPEANGFLRVTIDPPLALAGWRFVGEKQWRTPGMLASNLTFGTREIEFRPVPGYHPPPRETVILDGGTPDVSLTRTYYQTPAVGSGGLSVTLKPDSIAGAVGWRFLGDDAAPWWPSGHTEPGLAPGSYLVECKRVASLVTPPPANVIVHDGETPAIILTYSEADALTGEPPVPKSFGTVNEDDALPYAYVGQVRSDVGLASGFVVRPRVVATAGHVVFNDEFDPGDGSPVYTTGLQWLFQRDRMSFEPVALVPRGFYLFDGYTAARQEPGVVPGEGTPTSQHYDVAALYFLQDAGRGGHSGYLASDATDNEFLLSGSDKILSGYPVDQVDGLLQGRMHATPPMNIALTRVPGEVLPGVPFRTYTTDQIRSTGGCSGGPLCVQFEGGRYYPAAIYLGGSDQTVVRAIDSDVTDLFERAEVSANGGENQVGGGITHTESVTFGAPTDPGILQVNIEPAAARAAGGGWRLVPETAYRLSGAQRAGLAPGTCVLEFTTVDDFAPPGPETVVVLGGQSYTHTYTYQATNPDLDAWRLAHFGTTDNTGPAADEADPDHDGWRNIDEFVAGTDPNDPNDYLEMLAPTLTSSSFSVTVEARAGRRYELQFSADLDNAAWTTQAVIEPLDEDMPVVLTHFGSPPWSGFYRIGATRP